MLGHVRHLLKEQGEPEEDENDAAAEGNGNGQEEGVTDLFAEEASSTPSNRGVLGGQPPQKRIRGAMQGRKEGVSITRFYSRSRSLLEALAFFSL